MEHIVGWTYNFSDGRVEFISSDKVTKYMTIHCNNPFYFGYQVCAFKVKKINPIYIEALRKELKAIDTLGNLIGFDDNMTKHRNSLYDKLTKIAAFQYNL